MTWQELWVSALWGADGLLSVRSNAVTLASSYDESPACGQGSVMLMAVGSACEHAPRLRETDEHRYVCALRAGALDEVRCGMVGGVS